MESLKEKLYHHMELYGLTDARTVEVSQELDKYIYAAQCKRNMDKLSKSKLNG